MSFLACIGKKSRKKRDKKNEPIEKEEDNTVGVDGASEKSPNKQETKNDTDGTSKASNMSLNSKKSTKSTGQYGDLKELRMENEKLRAELETYKTEKTLLDEESKKLDDNLKSYIEDIHRLEANNMELKSKLTRAEAEAAKYTLENQKLLQKIVGMEEKQAMMSRAELQSMIAQLEDMEKKSSSKSTELSGIRTNPAEAHSRKKLSQEDKQMSFRLTKAEARLSQSEDENKRLREDLKDMLASHTELQMQLLLDQKEIADMETSLSKTCVGVGITCCSSNSPVNDSTFNFDHAENLYARFKKAESDQRKLTDDYNALQNAYNDLEKRLQCAECEAAEKETLGLRLGDLEKENEKLLEAVSESEEIKKRLTDQEAEQAKLKHEMKTLENVCSMISARLEKVNVQNNDVKTKYDILLKQNRNQKNEIEKLHNEIEKLHNEIVKLKEENKRLSDENKTLFNKLQNHIDIPNGKENSENLQKELDELRTQHEDTLHRLSELSSRTIQGNTQFCMLDKKPVCPRSLADQFRHDLYSNEWSNAYLLMTEKMKKDEKRTLQILLEICTESFLYCKRAARQQMETIIASLTSPTASHYRSGQFSKRGHHSKSAIDQLPDDLRKRITYFRSHPSKEMLQSGVKDFLNQIDYERTRFLRQLSERELNEILPYVRKCFELSWCMTVQEPPMYLLFKVKHGVDIEKDKFDKYTVQGRRLDFVIWPAVFQDEVGPCLQKGVCQALPERS